MHLVDSWANRSRWRRHPVEAIVFAAGLLVLALALPPVPCGVAVLAVSAVAVVFGVRAPVGVYLRVMVVPLSFLVAGTAALALSVDVVDGRLSVSIPPEGLQTAAAVLLRSLAAVSTMMLLALSVPMGEIFSLLRRWHVPAVVIELMGLMYRLLFVFDRTLHAMIRAQGCRLGYRNLRTGYRSLAAALATLFIRVVDRSRRLEMGLAARGYAGELRVLCDRRAVSARAILSILAVHSVIVALGLLWQSLRRGGLSWPS